MKKYLFTLLTTSICLSISAQNPDFEWVRVAGGTDTDIGFAVTIDDDGNVISTGYITDNADFDLTTEGLEFTVAGIRDFFVQKHDTEGNLLWIKVFAGTASGISNSIETDANGNIYLTGNFSGTIDFDAGPALMELTANGQDVFILKIDANGNLIWIRTLDASGTAYGIALHSTRNDELYITGHFTGEKMDVDPGAGLHELINSSQSGLEIFILKLDSDGVYQWGQGIGGISSDVSTDIISDSQGDVYVFGGFSGSVDFDYSANEARLFGADNIFILKLSATGEFIWVKDIETSSGSFISQSMTDPNDNLIIAGSFTGTRDFDPGESSTTLSSMNDSRDVFVLKLNSSGEFVWVRSFGGTDVDTSRFLALDSNGDIYTTGTFEGQVDFDPGEGEFFLNPPGDVNFFIQKLDNAGNFEWVRSFATIGSSTSHGLALDDAENMFVVGSYDGSTDFDPDQGLVQHTSKDARDIFVLKMSQCISPTPDLAMLPDLTGECSVAEPTAPSATSNCASSIQVTHDQTFPITTPGTTEITWTFEDEKGNTTTQTQNVIITDATDPAPTIPMLSDIISECSVTSLMAPVATDNCDGSIQGAHNVQLPITESVEITWTYQDESGNEVSQLQNVVINDEAPMPKISNLQSIFSECPIEELEIPEAEDACDGTIVGTTDTTFPIVSSQEVVWTYEDGNGNSSMQSQTVTISGDTTDPVPHLENLGTANGQCQVESLSPPTAEDNCDGTVEGTTDTTFPITATQQIEWRYTDNSGNTSTQIQEVIIEDTTPPDADRIDDIESECPIFSLEELKADDNCDGEITGTTEVQFPITESMSVQWTFTDASGNFVIETQDVTITPLDNSVTMNGSELVAGSFFLDYQWLDCSNNNAPIVGETERRFTPTSSGSYAVEISNEECTVTSECIDVTVLDATDGMADLGVAIYPNPVIDWFTIENKSGKAFSFKLFDSSGKMIQSDFSSQGLINVDLTESPKGIYFLTLEVDGQRFSRKIVVD